MKVAAGRGRATDAAVAGGKPPLVRGAPRRGGGLEAKAWGPRFAGQTLWFISCRARNEQRGYTLVEVIVAFGVLALGLVLLLGTLSGATRQVRNADEAGRAALHAQSLLDQVGVGEALQPGRRDGEFEDGHFRWTLDVQPFREPGVPPPALATPGAPQLLELVLTVHWGDDPRQRVQLRSLRLVAPDASGGSAMP